MPRKAALPFVSVVISTYNGSQTIGKSLDSLLVQTYPKRKYEIIVVDDGSTDNTEQVVRAYRRVRYVKLPFNHGVAAARNVSLTLAKGSVYASFDDDCIASPDWLAALAQGYALDKPAGISGVLVPPIHPRGIVGKYVAANGGPSAVRRDVSRTTLWRRLVNYFTAWRAKHVTKVDTKAVEVSEFYGANCSFPMHVLRRVGGWDPEMAPTTGIEDRDISLRIKKAFPDYHFYAMTDARLTTDPAQPLAQYLCRPYRRGPVTLRFYQKNHVTPPLFPSPFLLLATSAVAAAIHPLLLPLALLITPQLLYFWWPLQGVTRRKYTNFLFSYIQLAEECMVILGILRGYWQQRRASRAYNKFMSLYLPLAVQLMLIGGWLTAVQNLKGWSAAAYSLTFILCLPGYLLLRTLVGYGRRIAGGNIAVYSIGLSIVLLMLTGLAVNELFLTTHHTQPLTTGPLSVAVASASTLFAVLAAIRRRSHEWALRRISLRTMLRHGLITLGVFTLPLLAIGGALTLNNGGTAWLALTALLVTGGLLFVLSARKQTQRWYHLGLYVSSLVILLGTSMRGWSITGHDVMQEYQVFQLTLQHAAWRMFYYQDAYTACLSITILPTVIQRLTGVAPVYVFKFVFQLFAALIAPSMYLVFRRYVPKQAALLSAIVFITFPTFFTDMMMLNRQETALLCLVLALLAGLEKSLPWRARQLTASVFLLGMVLSHYSTSYIAAAIFVIALGMGFGSWLLHRTLPLKPVKVLPGTSKRPIFSIPVMLGVIVAIICWNGLITHTSNNIAQTLTNIRQVLPGQHSAATGKLAAPVVNDVPSMVAAAPTRRTLPATDYYPAAAVQAAPVTAANSPTAPPSSLSRVLHLPATLLAAAYNLCRTAYSGLIALFAVLGTLVYFWKRRYIRLPDQFLWFGASGIVLILIQLALPSAINYGLTRVIQQSLLFLSLPIILIALQLTSWVHIPARLHSGIIGGVLVAFFIVLTGAVPQLTGAYRPSLAFSNSGAYYEAYYTHQDELNAATWLDTEVPKGSRIYSDEFVRRKLITFADIFGQPTLLPADIPQDSYVVLGDANVTFSEVPAYAGSNLVYYTVPYSFLQNNKNLLYDSGGVQIYK